MILDDRFCWRWTERMHIMFVIEKVGSLLSVRQFNYKEMYGLCQLYLFG